MMRPYFRPSAFAIAGLTLLLAAPPAPAQYPVGDRTNPMGTGHVYYASTGPGYSAYTPAAVYAGRYDFFPGKYTGFYLPDRFASSNGYYATAPTGDTPILFTSLNYPGIYGSYTTGLAIGTSVNVVPRIQTAKVNPPSDNPVGAPYYPLQRPLAEVPYKSLVELRTGAAVPARPALIDVFLPPDATLTFQGVPTDETGPARAFQSPPLEPGRSYRYDVRAAWKTEDGQQMSRNRRLTVRAGDHLEVDFNRNLMPQAEEGVNERPTLRTQPLPLPRNRRP